jgi:hypothetical protein
VAYAKGLLALAIMLLTSSCAVTVSSGPYGSSRGSSIYGAAAPASPRSASVCDARNVSSQPPGNAPNSSDTIAAATADKAGDYVEALRLSQKIIAEGDAAAINLPSTFPWRALVAEKHISNLAWANTTIGRYYENGFAVPQSYSEAAAWYEKAVASTYCGRGGSRRAQLNLGRLYAYGLGVPQDRQKARELWAGMGGISYVRALDEGLLPAAPFDVAVFDPNTVIAEKENAEKQKQEPARQLLEKLVTLDAQGWIINKYDYGSMRNPTLIGQSQTSTTLGGQFTYNHGQPGWVRIELTKGKVPCLEYWDTVGTCRPIDQTRIAIWNAAMRDAERYERAHPTPKTKGTDIEDCDAAGVVRGFRIGGVTGSLYLSNGCHFF